MSLKQYREKGVLDAAKERVAIAFDRFDKIYVSFSGGKDSGAMLNLCIDYLREYQPGRKITVLYIDLEAMYDVTVKFIEELIQHCDYGVGTADIEAPEFSSSRPGLDETEKHQADMNLYTLLEITCRLYVLFYVTIYAQDDC